MPMKSLIVARKQHVCFAEGGSGKTSVTTRKAVDVGVVGGGLLAHLAAWNLAKKGIKVAVIPSFGFQPSGGAIHPQYQVPRPLVLPCLDPHLTARTAEVVGLDGNRYTPTVPGQVSRQQWEAVQRALGVTVLGPFGSIQWVSMPHDPAQQLPEQLHDTCREAGVNSELLNPGAELLSKFPQLRLRRGQGKALWQPGGACLRADAATKLCAAAAQRAGVTVYEGNMLLGWREGAGGFFRLRHASPIMQQAGEEQLLEAGQLLLAPECWASESLALFGIDAVDGASSASNTEQQQEGSNSAVPIESAPTSGNMPVSSPTSSTSSLLILATELPESTAGSQPQGQTPLQSVANVAVDLPAPGKAAETWATAPLLCLLDERNWLDGETDGQCVALPMGEQVHMQSRSLKAAPVSLSMLGAVQGLADQQAQQDVQRVLVQQYSEVFQLPGPVEVAGRLQCTGFSIHTPDGSPVLDSHPGFQPQHVVVACTGSGGTAQQTDGLLLAPLLSEAAAAVLTCVAPPADLDASLVRLSRHQLSLGAVQYPWDTWDAHRLRQMQAVLEQRQAAALAREREQDARSSFKESWTMPGQGRMQRW